MHSSRGYYNLKIFCIAVLVVFLFAGCTGLAAADSSKPSIAFVIMGEENVFLVENALKDEGSNENFTYKVFGSYRNPTVNISYTVPAYLDTVGNYDIIFIGISAWTFDESMKQYIVNKVADYGDANGSEIIDLSESAKGNVNLTYHPYIPDYWDNACEENVVRLAEYLAAVDLSREFSSSEYPEVLAPISIPDEGIYHPDAYAGTCRVFENLTEYLEWYSVQDPENPHHVYNPYNKTIGMTFFLWRGGHVGDDVLDDAIRRFEALGMNVIPVYPGSTLYQNTPDYFMVDGEPAVDIFVDFGWGVWIIPSIIGQTEYLEEINVPVINAVQYENTLEEWYNDTAGADYQFHHKIPTMERGGQIESIVVSAKMIDPETGVLVPKPIPAQMDWLVDRTLAWMRLQDIDESEKKIAVIYYHHSPGKQDTMVASNLDVAPSICKLLEAMQEAGYDLGGELPDKDELQDLVLQQGRNIGAWSPGELEYMVENYDVDLLPVETYNDWFSKLPEASQAEVNATWGPAPGDMMVYRNEAGEEFFVFPKIKLGNVLITPQPTRGASNNLSILYHDQNTPPSHQYIAFYLWLNMEYGADAIIHFGQHGTQEWLPGKGVELNVKECWPAILIQDLPVVYIYDVAGIGEGIMAKRRGNCVIVDHSTPPIVSAGLYGDLSLLHNKMHLYSEAEEASLKQEYRNSIIKLYRDLNFEADIEVSADNITAMEEAEFEAFVLEGPVHDFLHDIANEYMPYGMHILGETPSEDGLVEMVKSLLGDSFIQHLEALAGEEIELDTAHESGEFNESELAETLICEVINGTEPERALLENLPIEKAPVYRPVASTVSSEFGVYEFSDLPEGEYRAIGYCWVDYINNWTMGETEFSIDDGVLCLEDVNINVWQANASDVNEVKALEEDLPASDELSGSASVSGTVTSLFYPYAPNSSVLLLKKYYEYPEIREEIISDLNDAENYVSIISANPELLPAVKGLMGTGFEAHVADVCGEENAPEIVDALLYDVLINGSTPEDALSGMGISLGRGECAGVVTSSASGTYTFSNLSEGNYTVYAWKFVSVSPSFSFWTLGNETLSLENGEAAYNVNVSLGSSDCETVDSVKTLAGKASISGTVTSLPYVSSVKDAHVVLEKDSVVVGKTVSDDSGNYVFSNLTKGSYTLYAYKLASIPSGSTFWTLGNSSVIVEAGEAVSGADVNLQSSDLEDVDAVRPRVGTASVSGAVTSLPYAPTVSDATVLLVRDTEVSLDALLFDLYRALELGNVFSSGTSTETKVKLLLGGEFEARIKEAYDMQPDHNVVKELIGDVVLREISPKQALSNRLGVEGNVTQELVQNTISDGFGDYSFSELAPGEYRVVALSYVSQISSWSMGVKEITIEGGENLQLAPTYMKAVDLEEASEIWALEGKSRVSGRLLATIPGRVVNVSNATVVLRKGDYIFAKTLSSTTGTFSFSNVSEGNYTLDAYVYVPYTSSWSIVETGLVIGYEDDLSLEDLYLQQEEEGEVDALKAMLGTASISGKLLSQTPFSTVNTTGASVYLIRCTSDLSPEAEAVVSDLEYALELADDINGCTVEPQRIVEALDGKYIPPALGDDPLRSPRVLPTGRNFYAFNPYIVPTEEAWEVGKRLVDEFLEEWAENHDEPYPEKVGFVLWSSETMRHKGVMESEILYLLGLKPKWDRFGNVEGVELLEMGTPGVNNRTARIDVVVTMSGVYRDDWSWQVELLDRAARLAARAEDPEGVTNYVKLHSDTIYEALIATGNYTEEEARELSMSRVFGPAPGTWGVSGLISATQKSGTWDDSDKLAELYINSMSYAYGADTWGESPDAEVFRQALGGTDAVLFSRSGNSNRGGGSVIFDHVFEFYGGMGMAVRHISGETPEMYIVNLMNPDPTAAVTETLGEFLTRDLRSKYYNPKWIEGMMGNDYAGAREIASMLDDFWGLEVMLPEYISDEMWKEMFEVYIQDKYNMGLDDWFEENNPYAKQSMSARMLEAVRKGYWDADQQTIDTLTREYVESVVESGVTCCGHTCGNPLLDDYIRGIVSVPDSSVVDADVMEDYERLMAEARGETLETDSPEGKKHSSSSGAKAEIVSKEEYYSDNENSSLEIGSGVGTDLSEAPTDKADMKSRYVEGYEMTKEKIKDKIESESMPFSASDIVGAVILLLFMGAIYLGYGKKKT